jgi:MPBQ/MSBQ methyltransferase
MTTLEVPEQTTRQASDFQRYYEEAGPDYATWSPNFNMHFGYFRWGMNPFNRESMLEQMNLEILNRLHLHPDQPTRILDLGCGLSATLRSFAHHLPQADLTGITLVPWQIDHGTQLNRAASNDRINLIHGDYEQAPLASETFDAVYALESSCHAHGTDKAQLLREAHRLLRPGGRLAVADAFLLKPDALHGPQRRIYRKLCECWVIDTLAELASFTAELTRLGFRDIQVEHLQYRVAPSVFHIPWVTARFLITDVLFGKRRMTRARWNNIIGPAILPLVSHPLGPMSYCMVTATKT